MIEPITNPYESATAAPEQEPLETRWRVVPATISTLVGLLILGLGFFVLFSALGDSADRFFPLYMLASVVWLGFGAGWVLAGWLYMTKRYRLATATNVICLLVVVAIIYSVEV